MNCSQGRADEASNWRGMSSVAAHFLTRGLVCLHKRDCTQKVSEACLRTTPDRAIVHAGEVSGEPSHRLLKRVWARDEARLPAGDGDTPNSARRAGTHGRGRFKTLTCRSWRSRSRTTRAVRARSVSRSARSRAPDTRTPDSASAPCRNAGGRWMTATDSRASGSAAWTNPKASGSSSTARWQV